MQNITLIKLGGSIITHKEVPMMVREEVLTALVDEIRRAQKVTGGLFIIGHGQGSFAHAPAMRYKTMDGFISAESVFGMAVTQDSAAQLNRIVVHRFLGAEMPAVSFTLSNAAVASKHEVSEIHLSVLIEYLEKGLLPVTCGDVIIDREQGCTIWSTEDIFDNVMVALQKNERFTKKFRFDRVVHVSEVAGVLDGEGNTIPVITAESKEEVRSFMKSTKGFDVTGGMWHKIEACLSSVAMGVPTAILSGLVPNNLYHCLVNKPFVGTKVL